MRYVVTESEIFIRLGEGEEIRNSICQVLGEFGVTSAVVASGIGMLREVTLGWYTPKRYITETKEETFELINLSGNISLREGEFYPHFHVTLGKKDHTVIGGHALNLIVHQNAEICIIPMRSIDFQREYDGAYLALAPEPKKK